MKEVLTLADDLHERGIGLRILTGRLAGTYSPTGEGKFFFTMMAAFAKLERDMLHERTMAASPPHARRDASADARSSWTPTSSRLPPPDVRGREPDPDCQGARRLSRERLPTPRQRLGLKSTERSPRRSRPLQVRAPLA